jgi:hypothetical protein
MIKLRNNTAIEAVQGFMSYKHIYKGKKPTPSDDFFPSVELTSLFRDSDISSLFLYFKNIFF